MPNYNKGAKYERELFELLRKKGYAVVRVAGSGRARHEQPDLLASNGSSYYGIECKFSSTGYKTIEKKEVNDLILFCKEFGCIPVLAFRFTNSKWKFIVLSSYVDSNVSVKKKDNLPSIDELFP